MGILVKKADGKDIRSIMAVETHIKVGLRDGERNWRNAYNYYPLGRKRLEEKNLIALAENIIVAKSSKGKILGYGILLPDSTRGHYMHEWEIVFDATLRANAALSLDDVNEMEKPRMGTFILAYKENAPATAISLLLGRIVAKARKHPEIAILTAYMPKGLEALARKAGMVSTDDADAIYCSVTFQGKRCAPMPTGTISAYVDGAMVKLPATRENLRRVWLANQETASAEYEARKRRCRETGIPWGI